MLGSTFYIKTFGCKVNQYESQLIRESLTFEGLLEVEDLDSAELVIINGCAVTKRAELKSKKLALDVVSKGKLVVLTGCAATALAADVLLDDRIILIPQDRKNFLPKRLGLKKASLVSKISAFRGHNRAFVKLQDGCSMKCAYCYIPILRGSARLRPISEVREELKNLAEAGYKEVVFTGICLGWNKQDRYISELACFAMRQLKIPRIRLSSLEPFSVSDKICSLLAEGIVCEHLHIPFQSGSNKILNLMNRPYTVEDYVRIVNRVRSFRPDVAISTDIMVGFPGETEKDFEMTVGFLKQVRPMRIHVFPYSIRPNTIAARLNGQVEDRIKKYRAARIMKLSDLLAREYIANYINRELEVLFEAKRNNVWFGKTRNYLEVKVKSHYELYNTIRSVLIKDVDLYGTLTH